MTDIDITAAIKAADYALRADNNAADNDPLDESWHREAEVAVTAALPHILAQVEARVKPSRDAIIDVLKREFEPFLAHSPHNPGKFWGQSADAVLSLLPGRTEQEVIQDYLEKRYTPTIAIRVDSPEFLSMYRGAMREEIAAEIAGISEEAAMDLWWEACDDGWAVPDDLPSRYLKHVMREMLRYSARGGDGR